MSNESSSRVEPPFIFECMDCGERVEAKRRVGDCPECGGELQNLSKPKE